MTASEADEAIDDFAEEAEAVDEGLPPAKKQCGKLMSATLPDVAAALDTSTASLQPQTRSPAFTEAIRIVVAAQPEPGIEHQQEEEQLQPQSEGYSGEAPPATAHAAAGLPRWPNGLLQQSQQPAGCNWAPPLTSAAKVLSEMSKQNSTSLSLPLQLPEGHYVPLPTPCRGRPFPPQFDLADQDLTVKQMPCCVRSLAAGSPSLRILCYGDSLTAGYCSRGRAFEPYGRSLCKALNNIGIAAAVAMCGMCGKTAQQLVEAAHLLSIHDFLDHEGQGLACIIGEHRPDLVIIMAGTNDLSRGDTAENVLCNVQKLHAVVHAYSLPTMALIPPVKTRGAHRVMQQRLAGLLINWVRSTPQVVGVFDVEKMVPRKPAGHFWDASDEVHMSAAGQRTLGERLGERIACFPQVARLRQVNQSSGIPGTCGQQLVSCSGTLTGMFAVKQSSAAAGNNTSTMLTQPTTIEVPVVPAAKGPQECRESNESPLQQRRQQQPVRNPSSNNKLSSNTASISVAHRNTPERSIGLPQLPAVGASSECPGGLAGRTELSAKLRKLADNLVESVEAAQFQNGICIEKVGLTIIGSEKLGGWSCITDVREKDSDGLQGQAVFESLESLADRACSTLSLSATATVAVHKGCDADRSGWRAVGRILARLHVKRRSDGGAAADIR